MSIPPSIDAHIGKRIRLLRGVRKFSQEKLATALGITFQQVQKYERGTNRVGAGRLYEVARILSVPIEFFFSNSQNLIQPKVAGLSEEQESFSCSDQEAAPSSDKGDVELLMRHETLTLAQAYYSIKDEKVRQNVLNLIRNIASDASLEP